MLEGPEGAAGFRRFEVQTSQDVLGMCFRGFRVSFQLDGLQLLHGFWMPNRQGLINVSYDIWLRFFQDLRRLKGYTI